MPGKTLTVISPRLALRVLSPPVAFSHQEGPWRITEALGPIWHRVEDEAYHSYTVSMSRDIAEDEDAGSVFISAKYLALDVSRAWVFATGLPFRDRGYELFMSPTELPPDWQSNAQEVVPDSDWRILRSRIATGPLHRTVSQLPLADAIRFVERYRTADETTVQLYDYYTAAIETTEPDRHFLLYAQALEVVRELVQGSTKAEKQALLPAPVVKLMQHPMDWLFWISNQRRETRHSINRTVGAALHPELTEHEAREFAHDADILVRHAICTTLDLPLIVAINGHSQEAA